jgi:molybdenum cofactor biosynthesis protein B
MSAPFARRLIGSPIHNIDVVVTTGGTGLTGRDVTPEALKPLFEKEIEGLCRRLAYAELSERRPLDAAIARLRGRRRGKFIFALPGSNGACKDGWEKIIRWQLDSRHTPCNLVEIMPRLLER